MDFSWRWFAISGTLSAVAQGAANTALTPITVGVVGAIIGPIVLAFVTERIVPGSVKKELREELLSVRAEYSAYRDRVEADYIPTLTRATEQMARMVSIVKARQVVDAREVVDDE